MNHSHRTTHKRRGFTIVELVIVIAVIGILATVLVPTFGDVISKAQDSKAMQAAKNAYTQYMIDHAAEGDVAEFMIYDADGRFVAIYNGAAIGVYSDEPEALKVLLDDPDTTEDESLGYHARKLTGSNLMTCIKNFAERPAIGKEVFTYEVSSSAGSDKASIHLPADYYTIDGEPVKLVIMNRGAGQDYTGSEGFELNKMLLKKGYATLHVRGIPTKYQNSKYIQGVYGAPYGSPAFIDSVVAAYQYVTEKYNIDTEGCAVFGVSCGGLQSLNLVNAEVLPIKVAVVDAPVVDLHYDCYFGGDWVTGSLDGKTAAGVAWMYQFDCCDFDAGTYTVNEETYAFKDRDQTSLEVLWQVNAAKVSKYNPYEYGKYLNADGKEAISFPIPVKMWFGLLEKVNSVSVGQDFIERCRNGGTTAEFRGADRGIHGLHQIDDTYRNEMIDWISEYLPIEYLPIEEQDSGQVSSDKLNMFPKNWLSGKTGELIFKKEYPDYYLVSDFIEIPEGCVISKFGAITRKDGTNAYCTFYDKNKNFIHAYMPQGSDVFIASNWYYTETPPAIPEGAKYIRVAFNNALDDHGDRAPIQQRDYALLVFANIED